jgi:hypothetical protein
VSSASTAHAPEVESLTTALAGDGSTFWKLSKLYNRQSNSIQVCVNMVNVNGNLDRVSSGILSTHVHNEQQIRLGFSSEMLAQQGAIDVHDAVFASSHFSSWRIGGNVKRVKVLAFTRRTPHVLDVSKAGAIRTFPIAGKCTEMSTFKLSAISISESQVCLTASSRELSLLKAVSSHPIASYFADRRRLDGRFY